MDREDFKTLVKGMKAVYTQPAFIPDQDAFNVWFELLKDLTYDQVSLAIQKHMLTERFPPTIADLREKANEVAKKQVTEMSELEAWSIVMKAIRNSNYHADKEFEKLPKPCQIAVGTPDNLKEWAMMNVEQVATVEQSHFIRSYRAAVKRLDEECRLPPEIQKRIAEVQQEMAAVEQKKSKVPEEKVEKPEEENHIGMSEKTRRKYNSLVRKIWRT